MSRFKVLMAASKNACRGNSIYSQLLTRAFDCYLPSKQNNALLDSHYLHGAVQYAHMGFPLVREQAQRALIATALDLFNHLKFDPDVRIFFFTYSPEAGFSNVIAPVADAALLERKTRRLLQKAGLQGLCAIEFDVLAKKLHGEDVRRLIMHVHGIVWTRDPAFQPAVMSQMLSDLPRNANPLGMPSVLFQTRAMARARARPDAAHWKAVSKHPERDQTARSMAWMAQYMLKSPTYTKNVYQGHDGRWRSRSDKGHFSHKMALRLYELWSHFSPERTVFAVGSDAARFRLEYRSFIRAAYGSHGSAEQRKLDRERWSNAWHSYFSQHHKLGLQPSTVIL
jgi:hypothetical protein